MKRITITLGISGLLLLCASWAVGQSLGDVARATRKKPKSDTPVRHYDNDNLPSDAAVSVVGPAPAKTDQPSAAAAENNRKIAELERQKAVDDLKAKIGKQQEKIDSLARELDLEQREFRLRASAFYSDAGNRLRDAAQWDKDSAHYQQDIEAKQKELDAARQDMTDLQEGAHKAGIREDELNKSKQKENDQGSQDAGGDNEKPKQ